MKKLTVLALASMLGIAGCDQLQPATTQALNQRIDNLSAQLVTEAVVDCADRKYGVTHAVGTTLVLLVSCEDVKNYLSGSRIKLKIGNPNAIEFMGLGYALAVGTDPNVVRNTLRDTDKSKQIEGKLSENFLPAHWTALEISVPNQKADSFRFVAIKLTSDTVSFIE